jgi:hypothetical protein
VWRHCYAFGNRCQEAGIGWMLLLHIQPQQIPAAAACAILMSPRFRSDAHGFLESR